MVQPIRQHTASGGNQRERAAASGSSGEQRASQTSPPPRKLVSYTRLHGGRRRSKTVDAAIKGRRQHRRRHRYMAARQAAAIKGSGWRHPAGGDQRASQMPPRKLASAAPFDLHCCRGPNGERMSGLCASGRRRQLVLAVGSCHAQHPTGPNRAAAELLIQPIVTAGIRMHGVLRSARQQHGLLRLYAAYIVCQKHRARTGAGPKKDPRPARFRPVLTLAITIARSLYL